MEIKFDYAMGFGDGTEYFIQRRKDGRIIFGGERRFQEKDAPIDEDSSISPSVSEKIYSFLISHFPSIFTKENIRELIEFVFFFFFNYY